MSSTLLSTNKPKQSRTRATKISREELFKMPAPQGTKTWKPVKYSELVENLEKCLERNGAKITSTEFAQQRRGEYFFGVLDIDHPELKGDYRPSIAVQASTNKSTRVSLAVGARDNLNNLTFQGEVIPLKRRHGCRPDYTSELDTAVSVFFLKYSSFRETLEKMKSITVEDSDAILIVHDAFNKYNVYASRYFSKVNRAINLSPKPRTLWSLYNALASVAQTMPETVKFQALRNLGIMFMEIAEGKKQC